MCSGKNQVKALIFHLRKNSLVQPRQSADIITAVLTVFSTQRYQAHSIAAAAVPRRELETISCFKKKPLAKRRAARRAAFSAAVAALLPYMKSSHSMPATVIF